MQEYEKSMRINAPKGQKVIFKGPRDGLWGGGHADDRLLAGKVYTVEKTRVFKSHSEVVLAELPDTEFNTVMFVEGGEHLEAISTTRQIYAQGIVERRNSFKA